MATSEGLTGSHRDALRRRTVGVLFAGVALGSTGHIAAVTVTSIVALELGRDRTLAGRPGPMNAVLRSARIASQAQAEGTL